MNGHLTRLTVSSLWSSILPPAYFDAALAGAARDQAVLAELLLTQAVPGLLEHLARLSGLTAGPAKGHVFGAAAAGPSLPCESALPLVADGSELPTSPNSPPPPLVISRDDLTTRSVVTPFSMSSVFCATPSP